MKNAAYKLAILPFLGALASPSVAHAASGLGNLTYMQNELNRPIAFFGGEGSARWATGPSGSNTVLMWGGKMIVVSSVDSGRAPGGIHTYDMMNPRMPVLQKSIAGTPETNRMREIHAFPVAMIDGKAFTAFTSTTGLQFFDITDPMNIIPSGNITLAGTNAGDYDNAAWMLAWQYPYVFVGGTNNGVYVVDATNPAMPTLATRVQTGSIGNFRIGPIYAAGNYLIGANMDLAGTRFAVIDIGNPRTPTLLTTGTATANLYSALVVGDRIYANGTTGDFRLMSWSATAVTTLASGKSGGDRGGYCTYQSGFAICGQSTEGFKKWDTRGDMSGAFTNGTDPNASNGDFDFANALGNLVFLGNDHGTGSVLIPHQLAPDTVAPQVVKVYPNEARQPTSTRVTVFFSEDLDLATVTPANIVVRAMGGEPIPGVFSKSSFNAISFWPKTPFAADTTYEVAVTAGGVADLAGNMIAAASTTTFSTGAALAGGGSDAGPQQPRTDGGGGPTGDAGRRPDAGAPIIVEAGAGGTGGSTGSSGSGGAGGSSTTGSGGATAGSGGAGGNGASGSGGTSTGTGGSGGSPSGAGGSGGSSVVPSTGGSNGTGGTTAPPSDSGGCSVAGPGGSSSGGLWALTMGALALGIGRLRGRSRRSGVTG